MKKFKSGKLSSLHGEDRLGLMIQLEQEGQIQARGGAWSRVGWAQQWRGALARQGSVWVFLSVSHAKV